MTARVVCRRRCVAQRAAQTLIATLICWSYPAACSAEPALIHHIEPVEFTANERGKGFDRRFELLADRYEYRADDTVAQCLAALECADVTKSKLELRLEQDGVEKSSVITQVACPRVGFLVDVGRLAPGAYTLRARFVSAEKKLPEATFKFTKSAEGPSSDPWPADGLALELQPQTALASAAWPTHAAVPVPRGALQTGDRLVLLEDGKPTAAQFETVATWDKLGTPQWLHVHFIGRYGNGKPRRYVLTKAASPPAKAARPILVEDRKDRIVVDTGAIRFEVRRPFAGISQVWFDPTGAGKYAAPLGQGTDSGPYVVHETAGTFLASADPDAQITLEDRGPVMAVIRAEGWYRSPRAQDKDRCCRFVTRFRAYAGQAIVEVQHSTIFTDDMSKNRLRDVGFSFPLAAGSEYGLGVDGRTISGRLTPAAAGREAPFVAMHQERPERCRILGAATGSGKRSDGWFFVRSSGPSPSPTERRSEGQVQVNLLVKDVWQKYPKEVELGPRRIVLHTWPKHGRRSYQLQEELRYNTFYKLPCFHQGELLDLKLPESYVDVIREQKETQELRPEWAEAANASGLAMTNEFALLFSASLEPAEVAAWRRLYEVDPLAVPGDAWCAASGVFGAIAERGTDFPETEQTVEDALLGFANLDRIRAYGQFIYGNVHHQWIPTENRAHLHRVWLNNHYHTAGLPWMLFMRGHSAAMLRWARINADNYASIGQVRYDSWQGPTDKRVTRRPTFAWHMPGNFYHCKSHVPWGGEAYGMPNHDTHAGMWGHWCDPDGLLYAFLVDDNRWARDGYELWLSGIRNLATLPLHGVGREINTTLSRALVAYDYTHDPALLVPIQAMAAGLVSVPLIKQNPGSLWEPLWCARYYERTRNPAYKKFIIDNARDTYSMEGILALSLSATAYDLTGDRSFLERYLALLDDQPRRLYKEFLPARGGAPARPSEYNNYGLAPGPLGDGYLGLQWPRFKAQLRRAGIRQLVASDEPGDYPHGVTRFVPWSREPRGCKVYVLEAKDQSWPITLVAHSISGSDFHPTRIEVETPSGKIAVLAERFPAGGERRVVRSSGRQGVETVWNMPADGETGLYEIHFNAEQLGIFSPLTPLPEAAVIQNINQATSMEGIVYQAQASRGYLLPLASDPIELTIRPATDMDPMRVRIVDAQGQVIVHRALLRSRPHDSVTQIMGAPGGFPGPWQVDIYSSRFGYYQLTALGAAPGELLLMGRNLEDLKSIRAALEKSNSTAQRGG